jgi:L-seryl-tRNA(Ser) seleniumtransferase
MTEQLRSLPSVDAVLQNEKVAELRSQYGHAIVTAWTRAAIADCRTQLLDGRATGKESILESVVEDVLRKQAADSGQSICRVINATGIILHTNLGRSPLASKAIERTDQSARYANVELDLASGRRSKRGQRACRLLAQLAGAEDALVVNNCAAATMLVLHTVAAGSEVIVSRGQLVEIGGGFRMPDVFRAAGALLCEVGTTNRTYLRDYEAAIGDRTAAIIRVHRSNFLQTGFVTEPTIDELVSIKRRADIPVIDDLGSGCVTDLSAYGIDESTVQSSVASGAEMSLFSGDKLFGGPQAGIIVGRKIWIERLRVSPMMRAMRPDKLTLSALEATTEIHLAGNASSEIPILKMITDDPEQVRDRCDQLIQLIGSGCQAEVIPSESQVGGGSVPGATIASYGVRISLPHVDQLARMLRAGDPAIQGRVSDDSLILDLRTVADDEVETVGRRLCDSLSRTDRSA